MNIEISCNLDEIRGAIKRLRELRASKPTLPLWSEFDRDWSELFSIEETGSHRSTLVLLAAPTARLRTLLAEAEGAVA